MQIKLEKINKSFDQKQVLTDFNLTIESGDFVIITGKSGHGKTTLLNIIGLLDYANSGIISYGKTINPNINQSSGRNLLKYHLGYLFQNYGLIDNQTVVDNLMIALKLQKNSKRQNIHIIKNALAKVDLSGFEHQKIYSLSGGEQQRVAIARLIIKNCDVILADEPTSALDCENELMIMEKLKDLNNDGKTIIMVTHNPDLKPYATKLITI